MRPRRRRAHDAAFRLLTHRPLMPGETEVEGNPPRALRPPARG